MPTFPPRVDEAILFLIVAEGDNQPLPIEKATILLPLRDAIGPAPDLPPRLIYAATTSALWSATARPAMDGTLAEAGPGRNSASENRFGVSAVLMVPPCALGGAVLAVIERLLRPRRAADAARSGVAPLLARGPHTRGEAFDSSAPAAACAGSARLRFLRIVCNKSARLPCGVPLDAAIRGGAYA